MARTPGGLLPLTSSISSGRVVVSSPVGDTVDAGLLSPSDSEPEVLDAESKLLQFLRVGQQLYIKQALPDGIRCVAVDPRPAVSNGSVGVVLLGTALGKYTVHQGHWNMSDADRTHRLSDESWYLHGASDQTVLVSGSLLTTSKEACEADSTRRPLALVHERCGEHRLPWDKDDVSADYQWLYTGQDMATPYRAAGAYFSHGKRYPFEFFERLGLAWLTGPLAGDSGESRIVPLHVESGHVRLGDTLLESMPLLSEPPNDPMAVRTALTTNTSVWAMAVFSTVGRLGTRRYQVKQANIGPFARRRKVEDRDSASR